jgi:hypothetical protein
MIQHHNHYHVEKMMQYQQAEMTKKLGYQAHADQPSQPSDLTAQNCPNRTFWQRWFGNKRLGTT